MASKNRYGGIEPYILSCARNKAQSIARQVRLNDVDIEDLEQELIANVYRKLPKFDPARGNFKTFCSLVVNSHTKTLLRKLKKRSRIKMCSLEDPVQVLQWKVVERHEVIDQEVWNRAIGNLSLPEPERFEMSVDTEKLYSELPDNLKTICKQLKTKNITEISRETGVPRSTIYARIKKARKTFTPLE